MRAATIIGIFNLRCGYNSRAATICVRLVGTFYGDSVLNERDEVLEKAQWNCRSSWISGAYNGARRTHVIYKLYIIKQQLINSNCRLLVLSIIYKRGYSYFPIFSISVTNKSKNYPRHFDLIWFTLIISEIWFEWFKCTCRFNEYLAFK